MEEEEEELKCLVSMETIKRSHRNTGDDMKPVALLDWNDWTGF